MATKKSTAKKPAAKKTTAKKSSPRKPAAKSPSKKTAKRKSGGALHNVARSIGSTLGSIAKKTSQAVEAAKDAIPGPLKGEF